nr:acid phosphatase lmsap2 - Leishmania mexicana (fragments) [Leishmania mexicana]
RFVVRMVQVVHRHGARSYVRLIRGNPVKAADGTYVFQ